MPNWSTWGTAPEAGEACPHTIGSYHPSQSPAIVAVKYGDVTRLAEMLRVAVCGSGPSTERARILGSASGRCGGGAARPLSDATLTSRLYVRRRSEGDESFRPSVIAKPEWEAVSGIATPPRPPPRDRATHDQRVMSTPATPRRVRRTSPLLEIGRPRPILGVAAACPRGAAYEQARRLVRTADFAGLTALHHAARLNRPDMIKLLVEYGADVSVQTNAGLTPLHCAAENNAAEAALVLVQNGANPLARETLTWQPLHCASWNRAHQTMMILLAYGGCTASEVAGGQTAENLAATKGYADTVTILQSSNEMFTYRSYRRSAGILEKGVLLIILLSARRAARQGTVPHLPSETLYAIFGFISRRNLWRSGIVLQEYRRGFWHLPRLTQYG
eukprot:m.184004 g.184004  ORF g.184004 m.184004 type:complete len:389 (-) comp15004_c0_seq1:106-1272(-)